MRTLSPLKVQLCIFILALFRWRRRKRAHLGLGVGDDVNPCSRNALARLCRSDIQPSRRRMTLLTRWLRHHHLTKAFTIDGGHFSGDASFQGQRRDITSIGRQRPNRGPLCAVWPSTWGFTSGAVGTRTASRASTPSKWLNCMWKLLLQNFKPRAWTWQPLMLPCVSRLDTISIIRERIQVNVPMPGICHRAIDRVRVKTARR